VSAPLPVSGASAADDWDRHWREHAAAASENPAERMRVDLLLRLLDLRDAPARVLDVGSGHGGLLASLVAAHPGIEPVGLELSATGVEIATARVPGARFVRRNLLQPEAPPADLSRWATHAACSEVLEHVDDPVALLRNASAYMAPGCRLVITVPGGPMSAFDRHIGHRGHFTPTRLRDVLERAGFAVERVGGAGFPFFNLYRLVVVARGPRLVDDVTQGPLGAASPGALLAMRCFRALFRLNLPAWRFGWQIVAVARRTG
jgi:SAM-dependent methyltransferase